MQSDYTKYSNDELIEKLRGSRSESELAFAEIYRRYSALVHGYCACMITSREQIEDIFQETMIKFYQSVINDKRDINIKGFMVTIARNLCLNYQRDKKATVPFENVEFEIGNYNTAEKSELSELINMGLNLLDFEYREAFTLREIEGLEYSQVAELCGISEANARKRVYRARQKIKGILAPYFKDVYSGK